MLSDVVHVLLHVLKVGEHLHHMPRVGGEGESALLVTHTLQIPDDSLREREGVREGERGKRKRCSTDIPNCLFY